MQLPFVLLFVGCMGMASPLISSMLSSCSFATHVYSIGFVLWSFADQLVVDQLIIGFLAFAFSTLNLTFTLSRFWISY